MTDRNVIADRAFAPFGEPYAQFGEGAEFSFTGDTQDTIANTYDTPNRELNPTQGRWLTPDPAGLGAANSTNPQSWNRYAYVLNDPLSAFDPLGLNCVWDDGSSEADDDPKYGNTSNGQANCSKDGGTWIDSVTGDWNPNPNPGLAKDVADLQAMFEGPPAATFQAQGVTGPDDFGGGGGGWFGQLKQEVCSAIPSGRTVGASGGIGGVGSPGGGGELVLNYNSGRVSAFGFGGFQVGWNGGVSGSVYSGFVWGLNNSNSNYSGGFTGINGGAGLGGFVSSSSGGVTGGPGGLIPNPRQVTAAGASFGGGLLGGFSGGVTATNYTNPTQLGRFWAFTPLDWYYYLARKLC